MTVTADPDHLPYPGVNSYYAVYSGDGGYQSATSPAASLTLAVPPVQPSLTAWAFVDGGPAQTQAITVAYGQPVHFGVNVGNPSGAAPAPTGAVNFSFDPAVPGSGGVPLTVIGAGLSQTYFTPAAPLAPGTYTVYVYYPPSQGFLGNTSNVVTVTVDPGVTFMTLSGPTSYVYGHPTAPLVAFSAVSNYVAGMAVPTGLITVRETYPNTTTPLPGGWSATAPANLASVNLPVGLAPGPHSFIDRYSGDANYQGSTAAAPWTVTISPGPTQMIFAPLVSSYPYGQPPSPTLVQQAYVLNYVGGMAVPTEPTLVVETDASGNPLANGWTDSTNGNYITLPTWLSAGVHYFMDRWPAPGYTDPYYQPCATGTPIAVTVTAAGTGVTVAPSGGPSVVGQPVTFTATVTASPTGAGTPTGQVQFYDGTAALGPPEPLDGSGVATLWTAALAAGSHAITARYLGAAGFPASPPSAPVAQAVTPASTTTAVATSGSPTVYGQQATFTATVSVTAPGAGVPTGQVQFYDGTTALGGPTPLDGSGVATLMTPALTAGSHSVTATYLGTADDAASPASPPVTQVVTAAMTTTTLGTSGSPSVFGQQVTVTATVSVTSPGAGVPTGTVTFTDGTTVLGTGTLTGSGTATFVTATLGVGSHTLFAAYSGSVVFAGSQSAGLVQQVAAANSGLVLTPSHNPLSVNTGGQTDRYAIRLRTKPLFPVTVTIQTPPDVSTSVRTVTITPANWDVEYVVTVSAVTGRPLAGPHEVTITHTVDSLDPAYTTNALSAQNPGQLMILVRVNDVGFRLIPTAPAVLVNGIWTRSVLQGVTSTLSFSLSMYDLATGQVLPNQDVFRGPGRFRLSENPFIRGYLDEARLGSHYLTGRYPLFADNGQYRTGFILDFFARYTALGMQTFTVTASLGGGPRTSASIRVIVQAATWSTDLVKTGYTVDYSDNRTGSLYKTVTATIDAGYDVNQVVVGGIGLDNLYTVDHVVRDQGSHTITFRVGGLVKTNPNAPPEYIQLTVNGSAIGWDQVQVVVPTTVAPQARNYRQKVAGVNMGLGEGTSPKFEAAPAGKLALLTVWSYYATVQVLDQYNQPLDSIYAGKPVAEATPTPDPRDEVPSEINRSVSASGTYVDPIGILESPANIVYIDEANANALNAWKSKPALKPRNSDLPIEEVVYVAGHRLTTPVSRQVSLSQTGILTVTFKGPETPRN